MALGDGLGSTFWTGGGASALWHDLDDFTSGYNEGLDAAGRRSLHVGPAKIYQEPMVLSSAKGRIQDNPGFDSGYFYGVETTTGQIIKVAFVFHIGFAYPNGTKVGQWQFLHPHCQVGDLTPKSGETVTDDAYEKSPIYKTGFMLPAGVHTAAPTIGAGYDTAMSIYIEDVVGSWRLHHYSPYAWSGTPPEVIASAAMHAGLDADHIDQDTFDNAHDAYDPANSIQPWSDLDTQWTIHARRELGTTVADFLVQCAQHGRDMLYINEAGQLACQSIMYPAHTASGLDLVDDQVLSVVSWRETTRYLFNSVAASWGMAARQSWDDVDGAAGARPGAEDASSSFEGNLETRPGDKWVHEIAYSSSVTKYGQRWLRGRKVLANFRGQPQELEIVHFPFLLSPHVNLTFPGYEWDKSTDGGGMVHLSHSTWLAADAAPKKEVTIKQGPMGFDTAIGDHVEDVALTADGETVDDMFVIEKEYNFDSLEITTTLLEIGRV